MIAVGWNGQTLQYIYQKKGVKMAKSRAMQLSMFKGGERDYADLSLEQKLLLAKKKRRGGKL